MRFPFADKVESLLLHDHEWVRIKSLEVYRQLLNGQPAEQLSDCAAFDGNFVEKVGIININLSKIRTNI